MSKAKGSKAERELIHKFWSTGKWAASRVAGSGSSRYASPDIIAGNKLRKLAIECKSTKKEYQYIEKEQVEQLKTFASVFGCETWIGVRFNTMDWYFLMLEDLQDSGKTYVITPETAKNKGLLFEEMIK